MAPTIKQAVVLGADLEGLAAAVVLAQAGVKVRVVDPGERPGGLAQPVELLQGHVVPGLLHETALVRRGLLEPLGLAEAGLSWRDDPAPLHVTAGDGELLAIGRDANGVDADAYARWRAFLDRLVGVVTEILDQPPPQAETPALREKLRLAKQGLKLRLLGKADLLELMRIATMPAWDWTAEWFSNAALRAGLTAPVLPGTVVGPRAAGTTALILLREAARGAEPVGGLAAVVDSLTKRCAQLGVQLQCGARAAHIQTAGGASPYVTGVVLEDGESIDTSLVLSSLDPRSTLLDLLEPGVIPHHVEFEAESWRARGSTAVHLLALASAPKWSNVATERLITAPTPLALERVADALKYRDLPEAPWLDIRTWSQSDPDCAPPGAATLSVHVHGVPFDLAGSWNEAARNTLRERVLVALDLVSPGLSRTILADQLLTPQDLHARHAVPGGHLYGGELALDQLWLQRPSLALCSYGTPLEGLFLCGASSHPGGPFHGGAGVLGARMALRQGAGARA